MKLKRTDGLLSLNLIAAWVNASLLPFTVFWCLLASSEVVKDDFKRPEFYLLAFAYLCLPVLNVILCFGFSAATALKNGESRGRRLTSAMAGTAFYLANGASLCLLLAAHKTQFYRGAFVASPILLQALIYSYFAFLKLPKERNDSGNTERICRMPSEEVEEARKQFSRKAEEFRCCDSRYLA